MSRIALIAAVCVTASILACDAPGPVGLEGSAPASRPGADVLASSTAAAAPRPVSGTIVGSDQYGAACGGGAGVILVSTGKGTVSHLGLTVMVSTMCLNLSDYSVIGPAPFTLRGANGDELGGLLTGVVYTAYGFDLQTTVTSGTGRFHGATGELVFPTVSTGPGAWSSGVRGWIRF